MTQAGFILQAPEVWRAPTRGVHLYSNKVDVWAMGCLTYEMLVGFSPFCGKASSQSHSAPFDVNIMHAQLEFPPAARSVISAPMKEFIRAALNKVAAKRPCAQARMLAPPTQNWNSC